MSELLDLIKSFLVDPFINFINNQWDLSDNVFNDSSLIGINISWNNLLSYILTYTVAIILIILVVKFFVKLLGIFTWQK